MAIKTFLKAVKEGRSQIDLATLDLATLATLDLATLATLATPTLHLNAQIAFRKV